MYSFAIIPMLGNITIPFIYLSHCTCCSDCFFLQRLSVYYAQAHYHAFQVGCLSINENANTIVTEIANKSLQH